MITSERNGAFQKFHSQQGKEDTRPPAPIGNLKPVSPEVEVAVLEQFTTEERWTIVEDIDVDNDDSDVQTEADDRLATFSKRSLDALGKEFRHIGRVLQAGARRMGTFKAEEITFSELPIDTALTIGALLVEAVNNATHALNPRPAMKEPKHGGRWVSPAQQAAMDSFGRRVAK